ncbi:hypothetical protein CTEN210_16267 [Chaetoceros tenuissimus]|uniref:Uncharacterized protein n=1 Tax=Chaetoceros tenuissimus TaxID=426638 RepID=A0AAD3HE01_9STRA|nr:hypothetical protein CTEN210_16267 [Chaetoceros tenuissimus]
MGFKQLSKQITTVPTTSTSPFLSNETLMQIPEPIRFMIAGLFGNVGFFAIDSTIYNTILLPLASRPKASSVLKRNKETISFFISYLIQVVMQHFLNAIIVYGADTIDTWDKYKETLLLTYSSYSVSLVGSTIGNAVLIQNGIDRNIAFWGTIIGFGFVNFFLLKYLIQGRTEEDKEEELKKNGRKTMDKKQVGRLSRFRGGHQLDSSNLFLQQYYAFMVSFSKQMPAIGI